MISRPRETGRSSLENHVREGLKAIEGYTLLVGRMIEPESVYVGVPTFLLPELAKSKPGGQLALTSP
ncbi:hypothetical protein MNQ98_21525 [Paenibacillus sp. N3/727]|uniref:hypothetical protein n=1 Tax=Paenibacillus sp. N3/727 TaxID=2925845 RepID=UPI001F5340DD|nr:hypothetical protein [Paenibacillus sp. N3/727]UNK17045.1 hypothetical protein MNQ98_21525 [Paenibacillus sp. N3/727]